MTATAIVAAALANKAGNAGAAWTRLSWVLGLGDLGFEVHLVEEMPPGAPSAAQTRWFDEVTRAFGLAGRASLIDFRGRALVGLDAAELAGLASEAALLVNVSGHLRRPEVTDRAATSVYLDLDPGYTQVWHHDGLLDLGHHDHHYTVGELVGTPACDVPTGGVAWRPVRQPVVLADWPVQTGAGDRFTTVAAWRGPYGTLEHAGRVLGGKVHEFRRFAALPARAPGHFEVALDIDPADGADRTLLQDHGWALADPARVAGDPQAFRSYVQGSAAEVSVAQGVYVHAGTGWFGDRTVRYLASGRPALIQDTGFSAVLGPGPGAVPFVTMADAVSGATSILEDYDRHAAAARHLAEEHFASDVVLGRLCQEVGVAP